LICGFLDDVFDDDYEVRLERVDGISGIHSRTDSTLSEDVQTVKYQYRGVPVSIPLGFG